MRPAIPPAFHAEPRRDRTAAVPPSAGAGLGNGAPVDRHRQARRQMIADQPSGAGANSGLAVTVAFGGLAKSGSGSRGWKFSDSAMAIRRRWLRNHAVNSPAEHFRDVIASSLRRAAVCAERLATAANRSSSRPSGQVAEVPVGEGDDQRTTRRRSCGSSGRTSAVDGIAQPRALGAVDHHLRSGSPGSCRGGRQRDVVEGQLIMLPCPVPSRRRSAAKGTAMTAYSPQLTSQAGGSTWSTGPCWSGEPVTREIRVAALTV